MNKTGSANDDIHFIIVQLLDDIDVILVRTSFQSTRTVVRNVYPETQDTPYSKYFHTGVF